LDLDYGGFCMVPIVYEAIGEK